MLSSPKFLDVVAGATVDFDGRRYVVDKLLDHRTVLAKDAETGAWKQLHVPLLSAVSPAGPDGPAELPSPDLAAHPDLAAAAQERLEAIRPLIDNPQRTKALVEEVAKKAGKKRSTIYAWLRAYEDAPQLSTLIPGVPGPEKGVNTLDAKVEQVLEAAIKRGHRTRQRNRVTETWIVAKEMCKRAGLPAPHINTVRARIRALPRERTLRERGQEELFRNTLEPVPDSIPAAVAPLAAVQMDHAELDVMVVDDTRRLPLDKPWATVMIDEYSRNFLGLVVSLERPNAAAAGRCIAHALLPKDEYLKSLGVEGEWDAWGPIGTLKVDNAKEFDGELLTASCEEYKIALEFRKVKKPRYGAHIERLIGTLQGKVRTLPGATASNTEDREGLDPEGQAAMTLKDLEAQLVRFIVGDYHRDIHSTLEMTPAAKWEEGVAGVPGGKPGIGIPKLPKDPKRLKLDFLPFFWVPVGRRGITLDKMTFYNDVLRHRIREPDPESRKKLRRFLVRRDPRDITRIWFLDPDTNKYTLVPTRDLSRPAVSLWEWRAIKKDLRAKGKKTYDEDAHFKALAEMREHVEASVERTKAAREEDRKAARQAGKKAAKPKKAALRHHQRVADAASHAAEATDQELPRVDLRKDSVLPPPAPPPRPAPSGRKIVPFEDIDG